MMLESAGERTPGRAAAVAGVVATQVLFPLWLFAGAVFKLLAGSTSSLPVTLIKGLGGLGVDLVFVLHFSVAAELAVVGLVLLLPRLARAISMFILGFFFVILIGDIALGAATCGCFGSVQLSPWLTMVIDALLFAGILVLGRKAPSLAFCPTTGTWRVVLALLWVLACFALSFGLPASGDGAVPPDDAATQLPSYFMPEYSKWIGRSWHELDLAAWVRGAPDDLDSGMQYLIFYRKDCDHCHALMEIFFEGPLEHPTTAIAVPERGGFPTEGVYPMPCSECRLAELPSGCDWFMQTPVLVRLEEGVVACAAEVEASTPECFQW